MLRRLVKTKNTPLDARWFNRFDQLMRDVRETYIALMPPDDVLAEKRRHFEASHCTADVDLRATHLDQELYVDHIEKLYQLRRAIQAEEKNKYVRLAYIRSIDEAIAKNKLCLASARCEGDEFTAENIFAYGGPDVDIFRGAIDWIRSDMAATTTNNSRLQKRRDDALRLLPVLHGDTKQFLPSKATYDQVRAMHFMPGGYIERIVGTMLPERDVIDRELGDQVCRQLLATLGSDYTLADTTDGAWGVVHSKRQVVRPRQYRLARAEFIGIVCHEIGSHLLEAINGSQQPLLLLRTGLDRYEYGNEGRALLREQIMYPTHTDFLKHPAWEYSVLKHVLIGLAEGLHEHRFGFAEVYAVAFALYSFWRERRFPDDPANERTAREEAWRVTVRVLKGTDGRGGAYTKDIVYLEGNIRCWRIARTHPEMILYGDIGKFDIANQQHIQLLRRLDILHPRTLTAKSRLRARFKRIGRRALANT